MKNRKLYSITSVCKDDIIEAFHRDDRIRKIRRIVEKMDDADMKYLAGKMADDYLNVLYWDNLKARFLDLFLDKDK